MRTLLAGLAALMSTAALAAPPCPSAPSHWAERAIPADCLDCWQAEAAALPPRTLALDWIVPAGEDAPMAVAALPEAAQRFGPGTPPAPPQPLPAVPRGVSLSVASGLGWNGYIALNFDLRQPADRRWPDGAQGWVALVERVPRGSDGSGADRRLVRALAGPLTLSPPPGRTLLKHLVAVRLPDNARPERFAAVGWIADARGAVLLAADSTAPGCRPSRR